MWNYVWKSPSIHQHKYINFKWFSTKPKYPINNAGLLRSESVYSVSVLLKFIRRRRKTWRKNDKFVMRYVIYFSFLMTDHRARDALIWNKYAEIAICLLYGILMIIVMNKKNNHISADYLLIAWDCLKPQERFTTKSNFSYLLILLWLDAAFFMENHFASTIISQVFFHLCKMSLICHIFVPWMYIQIAHKSKFICDQRMTCANVSVLIWIRLTRLASQSILLCEIFN